MSLRPTQLVSRSAVRFAPAIRTTDRRRPRAPHTADSWWGIVTPALVALAEHSAFGIMVLGADRRVEYASRHARQLLSAHSALQIRRGILAVSDERIDALLNHARGANEPRTLELRDRNVSAERLLISRIPARRASDPIVLLLFAPRAPRRIPQQTLRDVYQLTSAEIQIVEHLVCGHSLNETAALLDISRHTVRTHVKRTLAKCAVRSQADLIRLVLSGPFMPATAHVPLEIDD